MIVALNYGAHVTELNKLGKIQILKAIERRTEPNMDPKDSSGDHTVDDHAVDHAPQKFAEAPAAEAGERGRFQIVRGYHEMPTPPTNNGNHPEGGYRPYSVAYISAYVRDHLIGTVLDPSAQVVADCRGVNWLMYGKKMFLIDVVIKGRPNPT